MGWQKLDMGNDDFHFTLLLRVLEGPLGPWKTEHTSLKGLKLFRFDSSGHDLQSDIKYYLYFQAEESNGNVWPSWWIEIRDFANCPVIKTLHFQHLRPWVWSPGWGTKSPLAWGAAKLNKKSSSPSSPHTPRELYWNFHSSEENTDGGSHIGWKNS